MAGTPSEPGQHLTPLQQRFVAEYLVDLNATAAYKRAGYKAQTDNTAGVSAHHLLRNPKIALAVAAAQKTLADRTGVTQEWVVARLQKEADREGEGASHSARIRAVELLGKHLGMFADRHEISGPDGGPLQAEVTHDVSSIAADLEPYAAAIAALVSGRLLSPPGGQEPVDGTQAPRQAGPLPPE